MEAATLELVKLEIAALAIVGLATGLIGMVLLASIVGGLRTVLPIVAGICILGALIAGSPQGAAFGLHQTMASTAQDMVRWYRQALRGTYFKKPETLLEFKRIHAMADAIVHVVP